MITAALGGKGTVTVKTGKATTKVDVEVRSAQDGGDCIVLDKSSVTIKAGKTATIKSSKPKNAGAISWSVPGSPAGISVSKGKVTVDAATAPGHYFVQAQDTAGGYNTAYCEVIVK